MTKRYTHPHYVEVTLDVFDEWTHRMRTIEASFLRLQRGGIQMFDGYAFENLAKLRNVILHNEEQIRNKDRQMWIHLTDQLAYLYKEREGAEVALKTQAIREGIFGH